MLCKHSRSASSWDQFFFFLSFIAHLSFQLWSLVLLGAFFPPNFYRHLLLPQFADTGIAMPTKTRLLSVRLMHCSWIIQAYFYFLIQIRHLMPSVLRRLVRPWYWKWCGIIIFSKAFKVMNSSVMEGISPLLGLLEYILNKSGFVFFVVFFYI